MKTFTFFIDPGHVWLKVPAIDIKALKIEKKISTCSYMSSSGQSVYLEEDCDANVFVEAYKAKYGQEPLIKYHYSATRPSTIRNMPYYNSDYLHVSVCQSNKVLNR